MPYYLTVNDKQSGQVSHVRKEGKNWNTRLPGIRWAMSRVMTNT